MHFPSNSSTGDDAGPDAAPRSMGPEADPGYWPSLAAGLGQLTTLRWISLVFAVVPLVLLAVSAIAFDPFGEFDLVALVMPSVLALFALVVCLVNRLDSAIALDTAPRDAARQSVAMLTSRTFLRLAVTQATVIIGWVAGVAFDAGILPVLVGALLGYALMFAFALPTHSAIERFRRRRERDGVPSYLWNALTTPGSPGIQ